MAKLGINTGSTPNDGTGDTLLAAALKINQNFDEIYTTFGDGFSLSGIVGYATEGYVDNAVVGFITSGALIGYATEGYVDSSVVGFITSGALSGYATEGYVDNAVVGYATEGYVDNAVVGFITSGSLSGYATEGYVDNAILGIGSGNIGGTSSQWVSTASGIHTLSNVGIGTTNPTSALTVKGNTSLETLNVSGVSNFYNTSIFSQDITVNDGIDLNIGTDGDLKIWHSTLGGFNNSFISATGNSLTVQSNLLEIDAVDGTNYIRCVSLGSVSLYYNGDKKLETLGVGVTVTGTTFTNQLSVSGVSTLGVVTTGNIYSTGIITATTFVGNFSGSITDATNLTGGTANASSLNVSGIATISAGRIQVDASSNIRLGNLPAGSGSGRNIAIGDQVLASLSGGSGRNIGIGELSYYDTTTGQYNIGIGERAGQKVTTGAYNVILGAYDGNSGNLDIRTLSNNVVIADGQGNIRQYINSSGNVGIKTTVVTEALTVAGVVSATSFYGTLNAGQLTGTLPAIDGSALLNVVGSGSGVIIQDDATPVGTAGTINFGSNLSVSFSSGIATVSSSIAGINTSGTSTFNQLSVSGVSTFSGAIDANSTANFQGNVILQSNLDLGDDKIINVGASDDLQITHVSSTNNSLIRNKNASGSFIIDTPTGSAIEIRHSSGGEPMGIFTPNGSVSLYYDNSKKFETTGAGVSVYGDVYVPTGIITASSFSGSASGLTNIPSGQLTGALPAIDGSALLNVTAAGTGVVVEDDQVNVGSATTIDFGTGLDVTFSAGIATITASGGSLQSRTIVTGVTTSIANNGIGNTNITGFKSYALMKVGLSTAGWLRLYTDSTSRANDASRSVGVDPAPGSGVIAEVVTTGISTTQIISPFVMGGNLDNPADTTIYAAITNLSGSTQAITANLTILQLEA
jgi:hypothetical protein